MIIESCQCLCLDKRIKYWKQLEKDALAVGIPFEPFVVGGGKLLDHYDYIDNPNPDVSRWGYGVPGLKHTHWNALQSHKAMIRKTIVNKKDNVLFLEDDAYITSKFSDIWSKISKILTQSLSNWDIIYLGWWINGGDDSEFTLNTEKIYEENGEFGFDKIIQVGGLHGALINHTMYDTILRLPENNPIDYQLNRFHNCIQSYYIYPRLIHVKSIYSETEGCIFSRDEKL